MRREWFGTDQHRLDKFMMLIRRCIRQLFAYCSSRSWSPEACEGISGLLERGITSSAESTPSMGLLFHVADVILEELAKVESPEKGLQAVLQPFAALIANSKDARIRQHISERVFHHLIQQSPLGIEFQEKFEAWKQAGFPGSSWRDMEPVEASDDEQLPNEHSEDEISRLGQGEKLLDPRAGKVDVELPTIDFDAAEVAALLKSHVQKATNIKQRKALNVLASQFLGLSKGQYPLGFKKPPGSTERRNRAKYQEELWQAAENLIEFEEDLLQMNADNDDDESNSSQFGRKRKRRNEDTEAPKSKRKKSKLSALVETEKSVEAVATVLSNNAVPKKLVKTVDYKKGNKSSTSAHREEEDKQANCKLISQTNDETLDISIAKRLETNETTDENKGAGSESKRAGAFSGKMLKKRKKRKLNFEEGMNAKSAVVQTSHTVNGIKQSSKKKKGKRKQKGKGVTVVQNDENSWQQPDAVSNSNQMDKLHSSDIDIAKQKLSHNSGKKKMSLSLPETPQRCGETSMVRRSLTLQRASSASTTKKRSSLSSWIITDVTQNPVSPNVSVKENGVSATCTDESALPGTTPEVSRSLKTPKSAKKVNIVLNRNVAHEERDYHRVVKQSPDIPFDANKKPVQGVLKAGLLLSPVNPFYRKSKRLNL